MSEHSDCLQLVLQAHPLQIDSPENLLLELHLSATFRAQVLPILDGSVRFGLRGGCLQVMPVGCRLLAIRDNLAPELPARREGNAADSLLWRLSLPPSDRFLAGDRPSFALGTLRTEAGWSLALTYNLDPADLYVLAADECWAGSPTPNQQAILLQCLRRFLLAHCLPSPLQSLRLRAGVTEARSETVASTPSAEAIAKLQTHWNRLLTATSDNFSQLCALAELNPRQDFPGANLLGVRLTAQDLSEGTFARANLRGAYLCDADLGSTNLSATQLSGADLSGAHLSSADLRGSLCHRASFALANLGGADLQGADFLGANLTRANLNGARVTGLRLGENPGLEAAQLADLQARGAVVNRQSN